MVHDKKCDTADEQEQSMMGAEAADQTCILKTGEEQRASLDMSHRMTR